MNSNLHTRASLGLCFVCLLALTPASKTHASTDIGHDDLNRITTVVVAYEIQATTDLINWVVVGITTADSAGHYSFEDSDTDTFPQRFYRSIYH